MLQPFYVLLFSLTLVNPLIYCFFVIFLFLSYLFRKLFNLPLLVYDKMSYYKRSKTMFTIDKFLFYCFISIFQTILKLVPRLLFRWKWGHCNTRRRFMYRVNSEWTPPMQMITSGSLSLSLIWNSIVVVICSRAYHIIWVIFITWMSWNFKR